MISTHTQLTSYIHGRQVKASGRTQPNINPATNQIISDIVFVSEADIAEAIQSSQQGFETWRHYTVEERSQILLRAASLLRQQAETLAQLEVLDTGKPITEARIVDVISAADTLTYFAKTALAIEGRVIPHPSALIYNLHEPLGVCVGIGAWNYPLQIACWKLAPALMMGNSMIYKPSELTPSTTLKLAEILIEAGVPRGVFNVILGDGEVARLLLSQTGIAKITFTGSVATGKKIMQQAAQQLLPVTLELGGKSPLIIFDDANMEQAVVGSLLANFYTQGEVCSNGTRVYVHKNCYKEFISQLLARTKKLVIGDPMSASTQVGALISEAHLLKVSSAIECAITEGAELLWGGKRMIKSPLNLGNFFEPTILFAPHDNFQIVREEIFGPVMTVMIFDSEEEVITRANQSEYGLASGVFTNDIKRGHRVAKKLQAGMCWVNNYNQTPLGMPFGGIKQSGFGRENGLQTLLMYTQLKSIYVELNAIDHTYQ